MRRGDAFKCKGVEGSLGEGLRGDEEAADGIL